MSNIVLVMNLLSFCNPIFNNFTKIFDFLRNKYNNKTLDYFILDIAYGFEIKVEIEECNSNSQMRWKNVEKWVRK